MAYELYPNYKSGYYFSSLPYDWCEERLRDVAAIKTSNVDKKSYEDQDPVQLCNYVDVYYHSKINSNITFMKATASKAEINRFKLNVGDVVITKDSEDPFDIGIPALIDEDIDDLVCGYHLSIIEAFDNRLIGRYLFYALESESSKHQFTLASNGVTRFGLTQQGTKNLRVCVPSIKEQKKIADFLDYKTQQIDQLIEKKKSLIEKLNEQRIAVITQAVTKGIDKNAKMKPSGVDWLGDVPEHWETRKLKFAVNLLNIKIEAKETSLPYMGMENIESFTAKKIYDEENPPQSDGVGSYFKSRNVLFGKLRPYLAKAYLCETEGFCSSELLVLEGKTVLPEYLVNLVLSDWFIELVNSSTYGAKMPRASWDYIGNMTCPIPEKEGQKYIVSFISTKIKRIEQMKKANQSIIERLQEYRSAIITAAVTGKIDVREIEIRNGGH